MRTEGVCQTGFTFRERSSGSSQLLPPVRERERDRETDRERERDRELIRVYQCVSPWAWG